jgi:hypothetical protein
MAKVQVVIQPTGLLNGSPWPEPGETVDLPDDVAEEMTKAGHVKAVAKKAAAEKVEKRPAPSAGVETRKAPAKKAAAKGTTTVKRSGSRGR